MKKFLFIALTSLFISVNAHALQQGRVDTAFDTVTVAGTGSSVTSRMFNVSSINKLGYWMKLQPRTGNAGYNGSSIALYMEASYDDTATNFATVSTLTYATNNAATAGTLTFPNMKFIRFRATGITGQSTDSTIKLHLFTQD